MRKGIPFMALMKEVYFIFDINLLKPEFFCKVFEVNQSCINVVESNKSSPRTKISLLSIIISEASHKRRLFGYVILIHENKQQKFSLSHLTKHYLFPTRKIMRMVTSKLKPLLRQKKVLEYK